MWLSICCWTASLALTRPIVARALVRPAGAHSSLVSWLSKTAAPSGARLMSTGPSAMVGVGLAVGTELEVGDRLAVGDGVGVSEALGLMRPTAGGVAVAPAAAPLVPRSEEHTSE